MQYDFSELIKKIDAKLQEGDKKTNNKKKSSKTSNIKTKKNKEETTLS